MKQDLHELQTRPFQAFFIAAEDLLRFAQPYNDKVEDAKRVSEKTHGQVVTNPNALQFDRSLSSASFIMSYLGLEAFANCVFDEFCKRGIDSLPVSYFIGPLSKHRSDIVKKPFKKLHLGTRLYFLPSICANGQMDPSTVFDIESVDWKTLQEVIEIRHSFNHANSESIFFKVRKVREGFFEADDVLPENFWPTTGICKDHRSFNMDNAMTLNRSIQWAVDTIRSSLPDKLNDVFMKQELMKLPIA